ncbi:MAG: tannase/feruloyl esterase family alpha/beta hydrolase [Rhizobacter sp.]
MAGITIPASAIGMATSGAAAASAVAVAASGTGVTATPEHCLVSGTISPVDTTAPKIMFKVALPASWNSKAIMYGGGGFDGSVPNVVGNVPQGPASALTPLARGYAVFASDSGHQANALGSQDGSFALNAEASRNFSGDALKKTHDAAMFLIKARYASAGPTKTYFAGGSTGGREALTSIQRWPADWDGAIAWYPAWNDASALLGGLRMSRALAQPGAYPSSAKRVQVYLAAMEACDALDGVVDELISNPQKCNAIFDPATAMLNGTPLRCAGGVDTGDTCLSDAQITALKTLNSSANFNFFMASGETQYPGYNVWGADLGISAIATAQENTVTFLALGWIAPVAGNPMPSFTPYVSALTDQWIKYSVTGDSTFNSLTLDPENPGPWANRISELSTQLDTKTDISAFVARGGKLLLAHGVHDVLVSTRGTEQYYQRLQAQYGMANVDKFARYYEIPGFGHAVSTTFNATWDSLTALEQWAEKDAAPSEQVVADSFRTPTRNRPLCDYPKWAKYNGSGDSTLAASFTCVLN